jgi:hypothetical protein
MTASGIYQVIVRRGPAVEAAVEFGGGKGGRAGYEAEARADVPQPLGETAGADHPERVRLDVCRKPDQKCAVSN